MPVVRRPLSVVLGVSLTIVTLAGIAGAGVVDATRPPRAASSAGRIAQAPPAFHDGARFVVAVVLGAGSTVASDVLAPYEVFARSPRFSVYTVAASAVPARLEGGPLVVPAHTFAQVADGTAALPDVVVVPAVDDSAGPSEQALRAFVAAQAGRGARILGVCAGSVVLAATGLLDGHRATSHWSRIGALERSRPRVHWVRRQRYVQDGLVTTTAGVTSGIPGSLRVMADLAGAGEADRVARGLGYPHWSLTGSQEIPERTFALSDAPVALDLVMPWTRPTLGVGLVDGVGEIDLAGVFEVYAQSYAARAVPLGAATTVTTAHGLVLVVTPVAAARGIDRLVLPEEPVAATRAVRDWARSRGVPVDEVAPVAGGNGFDAALVHLSQATNAATATSTAKMIDYPVDHLALSAGDRPWAQLALAVVAVLLAAGAGFLPAALLRARRRRGTRPKDPARGVAGARGGVAR